MNADTPDPKTVTYADSGVSIDAGNRVEETALRLIAETKIPGVLSNPGGYGGLFRLKGLAAASKMRDPVLVGCTDGVGTKLMVAEKARQFAGVGIDLVAMNVNDLVVAGAVPLFFLDYMATGKLRPETAGSILKGITIGCRHAGCALLGGETAEMPGMYEDGKVDLAGFAVGVVDKTKILDGKKIKPGDKIIGIASDGIHSNGYSLVRKLVFDVAQWDLTYTPPGLERPIGEELLRPTRIYVKPLLKLLQKHKPNTGIRGLAHITGGGFYENIPRILPKKCAAHIRKGSWTIPPIFTILQRLGNIPEKEMFTTFNMGIGMIAVVPPAKEKTVLADLKRLGETAFPIGEIHKGNAEVIIE